MRVMRIRRTLGHFAVPSRRCLSTTTPSRDLLRELKERQVISRIADTTPKLPRIGIDADYKEPITLYAGFDPTASSLHIGNMVALMALLRCSIAGHQPIALVGGATGLIGDPAGRNTERQQLDLEQLQINVAGIQKTIDGFFRNAAHFIESESSGLKPGLAPIMANNIDWYKDMNCLTFVGDLGRHFRISAMLAKESVKSRQESQDGISFTEFTYQIFQGHDFYELFNRHKCTVQIGGSDQWGNVTAGIDYVRRRTGGKVNVGGFTLPLLTTAAGVKLGKSMGNAVWIDADHTTSYELYQYLLGMQDEDVGSLLRMLTLLPMDQINSILSNHEKQPDARGGQRMLASYVVSLLHGKQAAETAACVTDIVFGSQSLDSVKQVSADVFHGLVGSIPSIRVPGTGISALDALVQMGSSPSKKQARKVVIEGGLLVNGGKFRDEGGILTAADHGITNEHTQEAVTFVRLGRKYALIHWK
eukprot:Clim_evm60s207 gene=Clim_evmTU60s207